MIFGENSLSDYFVVTNLQDKKIDKFKSFNKEDWSSAYQNVEKELTKEPLKISKCNNINNLNGTLLRNGPGILKRGGQWVHHPFDGDGTVSYTHLTLPTKA